MTQRMKYELINTDGKARRGRLTFKRGVVETPAFMPVGTYGTVKGMKAEEVEATGAHIILGNTFHLMLRPGTDIIEQHGGTISVKSTPGKGALFQIEMPKKRVRVTKRRRHENV